jgi:hypothetical protein
MNPKIENLRVIVVPIGTGNGIDQSSTVDEIMACEDKQVYSITDYFQAQNDEELEFTNWTFLIDITDNSEWTGANLNGVHMNTKAMQIGVISRIIVAKGIITTSKLELESSPCLFSIGNGCDNVSHLIEAFNHDSVTVVVYHGETEICETEVLYNDLPEEIIDEIHGILNKWFFGLK